MYISNHVRMIKVKICFDELKLFWHVWRKLLQFLSRANSVPSLRTSRNSWTPNAPIVTTNVFFFHIFLSLSALRYLNEILDKIAVVKDTFGRSIIACRAEASNSRQESALKIHGGDGRIRKLADASRAERRLQLWHAVTWRRYLYVCVCVYIFFYLNDIKIEFKKYFFKFTNL